MNETVQWKSQDSIPLREIPIGEWYVTSLETPVEVYFRCDGDQSLCFPGASAITHDIKQQVYAVDVAITVSALTAT
jgi:hypothetical protein